MTRLLLVSPDRVGARMAGPGIRYVELGRRLAARHDVRIAAPTGSEPVDGAPDVALYDPERPRSLGPLLAGRTVVLAPPLAPRLARAFVHGGRRWVVDLYNPELFEGLEFQKGRSRLERRVRDASRV